MILQHRTYTSATEAKNFIAYFTRATVWACSGIRESCAHPQIVTRQACTCKCKMEVRSRNFFFTVKE